MADLDALEAMVTTALDDMRTRTVSEAMWHSLMVMPVVIAELRAARAELELRAARAELAQRKGGPCETCAHNDYGDCRLSAIECVQQDPYFSNETLYSSCETLGGGCWAWRKREGQE